MFHGFKSNELIKKGAEASLYKTIYKNKKYLLKKRLRKKYRHLELDRSINTQRTKHEPLIIHRAKKAGVPTPIIYFIDINNKTIIMEYIDGEQLKNVIDSLSPKKLLGIFQSIGELVGKLHKAEIVHGDLTTSNILLKSKDKIVFIDFGLSEITPELENRGVDLHLMKVSLKSTHSSIAYECFNALMKGYRIIMGNTTTKEVMQKIKEIEKRGRYVSNR